MRVYLTRSVAPLLLIFSFATARSQTNLSELVKTATPEQVRIAIAAGAALDVRDEYGLTALMNANNLGHVEIVAELIRAGAHLDAQDKAGWTALMYAARHGPVENVRALVEAGADPDLRNRSSMTALDLAMSFGSPEMVELLSAAAVQAETSGSASDDEPVAPESDGVVSALMLAVRDGSTQDIVNQLNASANLEAVDEQGRTALMYAASIEATENLQLLLNAGANPNAIDRDGQTPLIHAAKDGLPDSIRALILAGANRDAWDSTGWTALMYAQLDKSEEGTEKAELLASFRPAAVANRPAASTSRTPSDGCVSSTTLSGSAMTCYYGGRLSFQSNCTIDPYTYAVNCRSQSY